MAQQEVDSMKWASLFDKMNSQAGGGGEGEKKQKKEKKATSKEAKENFDEFHIPSAEGEGHGTKKRLSVERIYQKKSQLEHILLRPDTYVGSVESVTQPMWVLDEDSSTMVQRDITFVPGLYKIFDEILVNAADNKQRDPKMSTIKIDIDPVNNKIKIWNNGRGIPVVEHKEHKMFVPSLIFGHLLTSSNYDDTEKKVTGGRNGYGAKLCNIFSKKFVVETSAKEYKKGFRQTWTDNMGKTKEPTITEAKEEDFTAVTFYPDLEKFKMESLDKDTVDLFTRRAYDIAAAAKGVKVFLNGKKLPIKNFRDYVDLYVKDKVDEAGAPIKVVYEVVNDRWEVAVAMSEKGFQQASFVNSIATTKGGRHTDHVADQIVTKLIEVVKKKNKGGVKIKPFQVKNHLWLFVNCLIENPSFDSQTKENMTLQVKSFGSKCTLSEKFITQASKCGIIESILSWMKFKAQAQLNSKCHSSKHSKLKGIPKLDDANDAGTKHSSDCTLILTEGDSAKSLAIAGLSVVGRDRYGVFPLRGKLLNVREATHKQIIENAEINNVIKIMGLQFKEKYDDPDKLKTLRYGKLMIMTDQDQDGSHIKGLLINFIHHFWPSLLRRNVVVEFITPIVKVTKGKEERSFYSLPEFDEWKAETANWNTWKIKYYKGLGTSTAKEAKEYFSEMARHKIGFKYTGTEDDASINLAFSKKKIEERKQWLSNWMEERKRRAELGLSELYLYGKDTRQITYNDFINRELILFSNTDNVRSIPSVMDGLKPGQRKVLYTCLKRNLVNKEVKVAQLAGSVAELSAYHHGEASLMSTIINLAQNFVGSNNLNLLQPLGQFGTRLHGGKDAASPRYIFTMLSPLARILFNVNDEPLLNFLYDDNLKIEPEYYCPIVPMVLVNGADGIGTGWSTKIPNFNIREIVANLKRLINGDEPEPMLPSYKNFKGTVLEVSDNKYLCNGEVAIIDDTTVEITELPIRTWTQAYKEEVLEPMLTGTEKVPATITDYKEYHTDTTVKFVIKMTPEKLARAEEQGIHKFFKLQTTMSTTSMVLFDHNGCIKRYSNAEDILREFYEFRMGLYVKRKAYLEGMLAAESLKLDNIARFIMEKIEGSITVENKAKKDLIQTLVRRGYDSDPVKAWKEAQNKGKMIDDDLNNSDDEEVESGPDFNYILSMPIWNLTKEKKEELCKKRDEKAKELSNLRKKSPSDLWQDDLEQFLTELDTVEQTERDDDSAGAKPKLIKGKARPKKVIEESRPSPLGRRIVPRVDSAIKVKAEKEAIRKQKLKDKREGKEGNILDFVKMEEDDDEPMSLADRLKLKGSPVDAIKNGVAAAKEKKPKVQRAPKGEKKSASPKKKGGKKKNPWSDSEGSDDKISDVSDNDMDGSFMENFIPRERGPRRQAAEKVKYNFDNEEEINSEKEDEDMEVNGPTTNNVDDDSFKMSGSEDEEEVAPKKKKAPVKAVEKKPPAPKKPVTPESISDDESFKMSESDDDSDFGVKKKKAPAKAPAAKKPAAKKPAPVIDSDSDAGDSAPKDLSNISEDDWLKITGQKTDTATSQSTQNQDSDSGSKPNSEPVMFDDSESDAGGKNDELFKPISQLKAAAKKPAAKKPAGEKKPKAPAKKKAEKKEKAPKEKKAPKKKKNPWSDDDSEDEKPKKATKKRPAKKFDSDISEISEDEKPKKAAKKRPAKKFDSDISDMSEDEFNPKKTKPAAKKKKTGSDDDDFKASDMEEDAPAPARARAGGGRAKAPVKYTFDDSDGSDFD